MLRKKMIVAMFVAALLAFAPAAWAAEDAAAVGITATVDGFAEWSEASPTIGAGDWSGGSGGHIVAVNTTLTYTKALTLYTNVDVTITPTGTTNSGILTTGAAADTLTTSYQIQGDVDVPDAAYKAAGAGVGEFFNAGNTYTVTHVPGDGSYAIDLLVQAESDDVAASDAGDYVASLTITATW